MKRLTGLLIAFAFVAGYQCADAATIYEETRYCGPPPRTASGAIMRNSRVPRVFQRIHPCPVTGSTDGSCPGFFKDHAIPLACGGCDAVHNMQWLDTATKRAKDATERRNFGPDPRYPASMFPGCPGPAK